MVVIMVFTIGAYFFPTSKTVVERVVESVKTGALSGPDIDPHLFINNGATFGGYTATTTGAGITAYTTSAADLRGLPVVVSWMPSANQTVTLASTTFLGYVPKIGDVSTFYLRNASTTAAATITFAALNANVDLQFAEATGGDLVLNGLDWAKFTVIHTSDNLITVIFDEMTEAD